MLNGINRDDNVKPEFANCLFMLSKVAPIVTYLQKFFFKHILTFSTALV